MSGAWQFIATIGVIFRLTTARLNRVIEYAGAPRPMEMGTILSPWRYDVEASCTLP
jgi:hypothetical protein